MFVGYNHQAAFSGVVCCGCAVLSSFYWLAALLRSWFSAMVERHLELVLPFQLNSTLCMKVLSVPMREEGAELPDSHVHGLFPGR